MHALKTRKIGNSLGVILPNEVLDRFHIAEGDTVFGTITPEACTSPRTTLTSSSP